jgi:hypothetical protein
VVVPRNRALAALGVIIAAGLPGCGGGGDSSGDATKVSDTVTRVLHALGHGDGATVCSLATTAGQKTLARALPHSTCPKVVELVSRHLSPSQKVGLETAKVGKVRISGSHATVPDTSITSPKGSLKGFLQAGSTPTKLTKQSDGSWKISG